MQNARGECMRRRSGAGNAERKTARRRRHKRRKTQEQHDGHKDIGGSAPLCRCKGRILPSCVVVQRSWYRGASWCRGTSWCPHL